MKVQKSGTYDWSWDFIFIPDGQEKTMGNFPDEERFSLWNKDGYIQLANYIKSRSEK